MIKVVCLEDGGNPGLSEWVKFTKEYWVSSILLSQDRLSIKGCLLKEIDLNALSEGVYTTFKLNRFGMDVKDIDKAILLISNKGHLSFSYLKQLLIDSDIIIT